MLSMGAMGSDKEPDLLHRLSTCFKIMGLWRRRSFWPLFFLPSFVVYVAECCYFFSGDYKPESLLQYARENITAVLGNGMAVLLYWSAEKARTVFDLIQADLKSGEARLQCEAVMEAVETMNSAKNKALLNRRARGVNKIMSCFFGLYIAFYCSLVPPLLLAQAFETREGRTIPVMVGPEAFWLRSDFGYVFLTLMFGIHVYVNYVCLLTFDTLYLISCHYISSKAMTLAFALRDIGARIRRIGNLSPLNQGGIVEVRDAAGAPVQPPTRRDLQTWCASPAAEAEIYAAILRCVKEHQEICRLRGVVEDCCSMIIFSNIINQVLNITVPIVGILLVGMEDGGKLILRIGTSTWAYVHLFIFCVWGEEVIAKSQNVSFAAFSVYNTGLCSRRIKVALEMMMVRAQKPLFLSAAKFFTVGKESTVNILQKSYTLCTFVLNYR